MKRLLSSFISIVFCLMITGQEPKSINYQVIVHNMAGEVVVEKTVSVKFSIIAGDISDTVIYSEKHSVTTNLNGLISLSVGKGIEKTGNFRSIDWTAEKYFLKLEIDITGGSSYTDMGTTQILSVPYALSEKPSKRISKKTSELVKEDEFLLVRKYVGTFIDYRQTGPKTYNGPNLIWIKTSMENTFGKISAYGKKCEFSVGDKLYIKRTYYSPGEISGSWEYQIENDSSVYYRLTGFQYDHKVLVETWFN